jgi:hypothetical protein
LPPDYVDSEAAFQYFSLVKELIFSLENLHRPIQAMQSQVLIHRKALLILTPLQSLRNLGATCPGETGGRSGPPAYSNAPRLGLCHENYDECLVPSPREALVMGCGQEILWQPGKSVCPCTPVMSSDPRPPTLNPDSSNEKCTDEAPVIVYLSLNDSCAVFSFYDGCCGNGESGFSVGFCIFFRIAHVL